MTALQLADNIFPSLHPNDTVAKALDLMAEFKASNLPVVSEGKYLGLIKESTINEEENKELTTLDRFQESFIIVGVNATSHFLKAANIANLYDANVIPVVNEKNEMLGTISSGALLTALGNFSGSNEYGAMIVLEIERVRFSLSEINGIVESDGASILHLNVSPHSVPELLEVTLQLNTREISTIIASVERYEYSIAYFNGDESFESEVSANYQNLMNYLHI
jgi:predicted transcriptional regulator